MASLTKRGEIYYLEWRDDLGRHQRKSTRTKNRTAAERLLREFNSGSLTRHKSAHLPLEVHLKDFLAALSATCKPQQVGLVRERIERVLDATGCRKIEQLTPSRIIGTVGTFDSLKKPGTLLSVASRKYYLRSMKQFSKWLCVERRYPHDVLASLNLRSILKRWISAEDAGQTPRTRFSDAELQTLFQHLATSETVICGLTPLERLRVYRLAACTGLRKTELSYLTPNWIDLEAATLVVPAGRAKAKRRDTIVLPAPSVEWLKTWLSGLPADQEIFPRLRQIKAAQMLRRDLLAAGLPDVKDGARMVFHSVRHTFCSKLFESDLTLAEAVSQARHSDPRQTMAYTHVDRATLKSKLDGGQW